jgi:hypothetical protein
MVRGRSRAASGAWDRRRSASEHLAVGRPLELDDVGHEPRRVDPLPRLELATVGVRHDVVVAWPQLEPPVDLT